MKSDKPQKPLGSISLDLDNLWSYMKIHGDDGWEKFPSYFDIFIPHILDILDEFNLKITFFIVGQDAALEKNKDYLQEITRRGHEVGNHSYKHESWLHTYSIEQINVEIERADHIIQKICKEKPVGFRGPGFSWSEDLIKVLYDQGYKYDASTLPTYIGPLARMYYFAKSNLDTAEREERSELFGTVADGIRPVKPYYWGLDGDKKLLEIPVTTIPFLKIPFHLSYLLYLGRYSDALMNFYLSTAIKICRVTGTEPSYLLHPLDIVGGDQISQLSFFPGMDVVSTRKYEIFSRVIERLETTFELTKMSVYAAQLQERNQLLVRSIGKKQS